MMDDVGEGDRVWNTTYYSDYSDGEVIADSFLLLDSSIYQWLDCGCGCGWDGTCNVVGIVFYVSVVTIGRLSV